MRPFDALLLFQMAAYAQSKLTTPFWSRSAMIEMLRVMLYSLE